jgi:hypothetical protein
VRFIFEATPSEQADFAWLAPLATTIHVPDQSVTWSMLVEPWLRTRRSPEAAILISVFQKLVQPLLQTCQGLDLKFASQAPLCTQAKMFFSLVQSLLEASVTAAKILPADHIECYSAFAAAWAFGGTLLAESRQPFHRALAQLTAYLPNDNSEATIFDYKITADADWELWEDVAAGQWCVCVLALYL